MDLSVLIGETKLNIRVSLLLETPEGYIFEQDRNGFYFPVGGRIQVGETSAEAAIRETSEELGIELEGTAFKGIIENFFCYEGRDYHEIDFVHYTKIPALVQAPRGFYVFNRMEIGRRDIRPSKLLTLIDAQEGELVHLMSRDDPPV